MTQLETSPSPSVASSLDLQAVDEDQRPATWSRATDVFFPGLSVRDFRAAPQAGWMQGRRFGSGELWTILSPPLHLQYSPGRGGIAGRCGLPLNESFTIMVQMRGSTLAAQSEHSCCLRPHDICLIDGLAPFELQVIEAFAQMMFLRIPRQLVLSRHPYLARRTAELFDSDEAGAALLRNVLLDVLDTSANLRDEQSSAALVGIVQMLGMLKPRAGDASWRVRAALSFIDAHLSEASLTAHSIADAQHISRRRLDDILRKAVGTSLSGQIWLRRLNQAATDLLDPRHRSRSVAEIAFACGFEDTAHFTRAFKRHHGRTPSDWRNRTAS
ncbi:MAG TPA: helix-turn-helix domain-containing protein [Steroidobacteraceae bacterium]